MELYKYKEHRVLRSGKLTFQPQGMVTICPSLLTQDGGFWDMGLAIPKVLVLLGQVGHLTVRLIWGRFVPQFSHLGSIIVVHPCWAGVVR